MSDKLRFRVSSGIKDIVGKDLITDDFIAVFELVKNSYDAHAQNVIINFERNKITISDDGKGMSLDDIENKWLFLAYSAKKDDSEDKPSSGEKKTTYRDDIQARTHYAGAKGIGRFSVDRIGERLTLTTCANKSTAIEQIKLDWDQFDDQNVEFGEVEVSHKTLDSYELKFAKGAKHGVILEIEEITEWDRGKIIELKHSLEKLINPFSEDNEFNILIKSTEHAEEDEQGGPKEGEKYLERDKVNGLVRNSIRDILDLKTTQISVEIDSELIVTKITDRGTSIYHIEETNKDFPLLTNAKIDLYFLNQAAKNNFTRKMGIEAVNFGSVFLFKNGFRVQPYGKRGDDSWGFDYRAQQGYNRFLGSRDLFGRVEITTTNSSEFKEVSSRDGGLVKTKGYDQLMDFFKAKGLIRLERYVVGVLWGEGFKKRNYFGTGPDAKEKIDKYRGELKDIDKHSSDSNTVPSNLGSKLDFIQIVKSLASDKKVKILEYNKSFVDLVNEKLDEHQSKFITDLERIAEQTNDTSLKATALKTEKKFQAVLKAKEEAERIAEEEEKKRVAAEAKAKEEEKARKEAEKKEKQAAERARNAELATLRKENERKEAEIAKLKAQQKAKEEAEKRARAEEEKKKAESAYERERKKNLFFNASGKDANKATTGLIHHIKLTSKALNTRIKILTKDTIKDKFDKNKTLEILSEIQKYSDKIQKLSEIVTYSDLNFKYAKHTGDLVKFIKEYISEVKGSYSGVDIKVNTNGTSFETEFSILEVSIVLDNLLSNATKPAVKTKKIQIDISRTESQLELVFSDNGIGITEEDSIHIFELGFTTSRGSGLGLYTVENIMTDLKGSVIFLGNNKALKGATFKLVF